MKNLKKLVSSVLVVTLLSGSAVSLSSNAFWPFTSKSSSSSSETAPISDNQAKQIIKKINDYHKSNSDKTIANYQAIKALDELKNNVNNLPDGKQKDDFKKLITDLDQILNLRNDLNNPGIKARINSKILHLISKIKDEFAALALYGLKITAISAVIYICYTIGFANIASVVWSLLKLLPRSFWYLTAGIFIGNRILR